MSAWLDDLEEGRVGKGGVQSATTMVEELRRELNSAEEEILTVGDILIDSGTFSAQGMMMDEA